MTFLGLLAGACSAAHVACLRGRVPAGPNKCSQYELQGDEWRMSIADVVAGDKKYFAPGNCRAAADNTAYKSLIDWYIIQRYGLRYSGGMVPDVHHVLAKVSASSKIPGSLLHHRSCSSISGQMC